MREITEADFDHEVLKGKGFFLVDFWAPWCGPCQNLMPTLEAALASLQDNITGIKVNIDDSPEVAGKYNVMTIPTLMIFHNGKPVDTLVGSQHTEDDLKDWITKHIQ